jgi:isoleucyl-tRNA synthetase
VIGDEHELEERAVEGWEEFKGRTPHRPFIDAVKIACSECEGKMERIPDVGNPWLDAGIVSFSTMGYRSDPEFWEKWYPADWISESFPGQFRNWFYSMLAMATVIDGTPPFLQNFGYASLLAEDGREMHKSWGNSIEFNEAADKMGVDVMRWLYCAHKPETNLLFGFNRAEEVRRRFLLPLWNVYSFLTTYALLDGWEPEMETFDSAFPEGPTPDSDNLLDQWVLARLNQVVARVTENFKNSDAFAATLSIESFIDDLTNWFVRRSRRRFWKSEHDTDKGAAYQTLYHVLVKLIRTLAPIIPFVTEEMYQNLMRSVKEDAHESIHHTSWPEADQSIIDEKLIEQMDLVRRIASLGLSARSSANIKVRQPVATVYAYTGGGKKSLDEFMVETIKDELNVKAFAFVDKAEELVSYHVLPNNQILGPKFGSQFPEVRKALSALDPIEVNKKVSAGESVEIEIEAQKVELAAEEILVETQPAENMAVASEKSITVGIDSVITPELRAEGLAREFVRRVQSLRKEAGYEISDRIKVYYQASDDLGTAVKEHREYIMGEVLANEMFAEEPPAKSKQPDKPFKFDGEEMVIGLVKDK